MFGNHFFLDRPHPERNKSIRTSKNRGSFSMRRKLKLSGANTLIISFSHLPAHEKDSASIEGLELL
jgi:hypothetical protein